MQTTDIIKKRELEIQMIKDQLDGVRKKIKNLTSTEQNLVKGLQRAEESLERQKEILSGK